MAFLFEPKFGLFTKFIRAAIAPTSKIIIRLSRRAEAVIAAPNWSDRNHPKITAHPTVLILSLQQYGC
ncbi:hypothetical protein [Nostoc sp.]|uniref:hypothetical protein n=1 Tax=Nostoc sp. TaxID=1180 RepID=UPI002FF996F2